MDGVVNQTTQPHITLTLDACGGGELGSGFDAELISLLVDLSVPAVLFLNQRWIQANPSAATELAANPLFQIESHGTRHIPLSVSGRSAYGIAGTADLGEIYDELTGGDQWFLETLGRRPAWFRPGTAHCDEVAAAVAVALGRPIVGFTVNADAGATLSAAEVAAELA
ncbi:MAG: polysaccharide deacetylase, partial [Arachnia propionica]